MKRILISLGFLMIALLISNKCYAEKRQINTNMVCCRTVDSTLRINKWLSDGDNEAVAREVLSGECQMLGKGTVIFVDEHGFEWAKVRQKGSTVGVWTLEKYLK